MKKVFALILTAVILSLCLVGCTAAMTVNHNLSQSADNFQVLRKITVYNDDRSVKEMIPFAEAIETVYALLGKIMEVTEE